MRSNPNAQNGAPGSISNQGTGPTTSPEQHICRNPVDQVNTPEEKKPDKPLTQKEKDQLIQAAIQKDLYNPILEWGSIDLYHLFSYGKDYHVSSEDARKFFLQLLLFVAKPSISKDFHTSVDDGLQIIRNLSKFFSDLYDNDHQQEFLDYNDIEWGVDEDEGYQRIAKRYLSGAELAMVLSDDEEKPKTTPPTLSTPWYLRSEPEENPFTLTDDQLLEALDRYHPGVKWPADKKIVIANEKMRDHLTFEEKYRLRILNETPEQKQKRLIDAAVYSELNGPSIPEQISAIGDKVAAAVKAPKKAKVPPASKPLANASAASLTNKLKKATPARKPSTKKNA